MGASVEWRPRTRLVSKSTPYIVGWITRHSENAVEGSAQQPLLRVADNPETIRPDLDRGGEAAWRRSPKRAA